MEERFEKIEASITSPDGDRAWTKSIKGLDQYKEILTFIKAELKANDKKWREKIDKVIEKYIECYCGMKPELCVKCEILDSLLERKTDESGS